MCICVSMLLHTSLSLKLMLQLSECRNAKSSALLECRAWSERCQMLEKQVGEQSSSSEDALRRSIACMDSHYKVRPSPHPTPAAS